MGHTAREPANSLHLLYLPQLIVRVLKLFPGQTVAQEQAVDVRQTTDRIEVFIRIAVIGVCHRDIADEFLFGDDRYGQKVVQRYMACRHARGGGVLAGGVGIEGLARIQRVSP